MLVKSKKKFFLSVIFAAGSPHDEPTINRFIATCMTLQAVTKREITASNVLIDSR